MGGRVSAHSYHGLRGTGIITGFMWIPCLNPTAEVGELCQLAVVVVQKAQ